LRFPESALTKPVIRAVVSIPDPTPLRLFAAVALAAAAMIPHSRRTAEASISQANPVDFEHKKQEGC
jgi:hypothetical protein